MEYMRKSKFIARHLDAELFAKFKIDRSNFPFKGSCPASARGSGIGRCD